MLKIYIQIFGTLVVAVIIFLNYQAFFQAPRKQTIRELGKEINTLVASSNKLKEILEYEEVFNRITELQFNDYDDIRIFFAEDFNEPKFMQRIQKIVDISGCKNNGIVIGKTTKGAKPNQYPEFYTMPKENLDKSVASFLSSMNLYYGTPDWQKVVGAESSYSTRLLFYMAMAAGKKYPTTMTKGLETRRFNLTVTGNYTSCKKFLYLISRNRPFTQATVMSFTPIGSGQGLAKKFACRLVVSTYVDKNGKMMLSINDVKAEKGEKSKKA